MHKSLKNSNPMYIINSMIRTQIRLPTESLDWLKKTAKAETTSMAEIIRRAVSFYQQHIQAKKKHQSLKNSGDFLLTLAEKGKELDIAPPSDLAQNFDQYLYQSLEKNE